MHLFHFIKIPTCLLLFFMVSCSSPVAKPSTTNSPVFDSVLAVKLKADEYGMKQYVLALLKKGPHRNQDSVTAERLQEAHMKNIIRLADEGKLCLAGPISDDGELRGIYIFNVETVEQALALVETDPAVKEGRLMFDMHPWYGSAALQEVTAIHKKIQKPKIAE